jgi:hypothetical protein
MRGERNRGREGAPGREDRVEGGITVEVLSSWRSFSGGVHHGERSGDGELSTEQLHCSTKKTTANFANSPLGFGVFQETQNKADFDRFGDSNLFRSYKKIFSGLPIN